MYTDLGPSQCHIIRSVFPGHVPFLVVLWMLTGLRDGAVSMYYADIQLSKQSLEHSIIFHAYLIISSSIISPVPSSINSPYYQSLCASARSMHVRMHCKAINFASADHRQTDEGTTDAINVFSTMLANQTRGAPD